MNSGAGAKKSIPSPSRSKRQRSQAGRKLVDDTPSHLSENFVRTRQKGIMVDTAGFAIAMRYASFAPSAERQVLISMQSICPVSASSLPRLEQQQYLPRCPVRSTGFNKHIPSSKGCIPKYNRPFDHRIRVYEGWRKSPPDHRPFVQRADSSTNGRSIAAQTSLDNSVS